MKERREGGSEGGRNEGREGGVIAPVSVPGVVTGLARKVREGGREGGREERRSECACVGPWGADGFGVEGEGGREGEVPPYIPVQATGGELLFIECSLVQGGREGGTARY